jgi:quinol monooxygenase YgiN
MAQAPRDDPGRLVTVTTMHARAGGGDALRGALTAVTGPSRDEPGCLSYEVGRSVEDPETFVIAAVWASPAALEAHTGLDHAAAFRAATAEVLAEPFATVVLTRLDGGPAA